MGACLRAVSVFAGRKREMLFDVIFVLLFVILKNPECKTWRLLCITFASLILTEQVGMRTRRKALRQGGADRKIKPCNRCPC